MTDKQRAFLTELRELTLKHGLLISGCGCCGSPYLEEVQEARDNFGSYTCDERGENVEWLSPSNRSEYEQEKWEKALNNDQLALPVE
jgi:hypothetical protein